jgi:hypothetical protein
MLIVMARCERGARVGWVGGGWMGEKRIRARRGRGAGRREIACLGLYSVLDPSLLKVGGEQKVA